MAAALPLADQLALLRTSPEPHEAATEALAAALGDEDPSRRDEAARLLLEELQRPTSSARWAAIHLLQGAWWPPNPALLHEVLRATTVLLKDADPQLPEAEETSLLWTNLLRGHERAASTLQSLLAHESPAVRSAAAQSAGRLGAAVLPAVPSLIALSRSEPPDVALSATTALAALAAHSPQSIGPALVQLILYQQDGRRYFGLLGLRALAEEDGGKGLQGLAELTHALAAASQSASPAIRAEAAVLIGLAGDRSAKARETLDALLADSAVEVRVQAVCSQLRLGQLAPARAAELLVPPLVQEGAETSVATVMSLSSLAPELLAPLAEPLLAASKQAPPAVRAGVVALFQTG